MKLIIRSFVLVALGMCLAPVASATTPAVPDFPHLQNDPLFDQTTYQELRDITVDVSWNNVELGTVLRDLTLMVRTTHPVRAAINFRMSSTASPADRQRKISLTLRGAPVYQVLEYLSQQASFTIKVHPDVVLIMPANAP
jgi:hypothetical protein